MKFNDTAPSLPKKEGPPPWLPRLAEDATLEGVVLKRPVHGRENIIALLRHAITLYDFQTFTYLGPVGSDLFMEAYRAEVGGVPVECAVLAHFNAKGETDSVLINHYPLDAALLFSRKMRELVGDQFGDLYLEGQVQ